MLKYLKEHRFSSLEMDDYEEASNSIGNGQTMMSIAEKLRAHDCISRSEQVAGLQAAFERVQQQQSDCMELVVLQGPTGVGKSHFAVHCLQNCLVSGAPSDNRGYLCHGTFDPLHNAAQHQFYGAFVQAFTQYCQQVVARGSNAMQHARDRIVQELSEGEETALLAMVPALLPIMTMHFDDKGTPPPSSSCSSQQRSIAFSAATTVPLISLSPDAARQFKYVVRRLVRAMARPAQPLVLLLDDVHAADEGSLELLVSLLTDDGSNAASTIPGVLFVVTSRAPAPVEQLTEIMVHRSSTKPLFPEDKVRTTIITLHNAIESDVYTWLSKALETDQVGQLSSIVHDHTDGNPLFVVEFLKMLQERGMLTCKAPTNGELEDDVCSPTSPAKDEKEEQHGKVEWHWDATEIRLECRSIQALFREKLQELPQTTLQVLRWVSCLGSHIQLRLLRHLLRPVGDSADDYDRFEPLQPAIACGILSWMNDQKEVLRFRHEGIRDIIFDLVPENERALEHCRVGRRLWRSLDMTELDELLFIVLNQILLGKSNLSDAREKSAVARLCLRAGQKAVMSSSFLTANRYFSAGIDLLDGPSAATWRSEYDLSLDLTCSAAETAHSIGQNDRVTALVEMVLAHARVSEDTLRAAGTQIYSTGLSGRNMEAVKIGLDILAKLDEPAHPIDPSLVRVGCDFLFVLRTLRQRSDDSIMRLPPMRDPKKMAAMQIYNLMLPYTFMSAEKLGMIIACRIVRLTLKYGLGSVSCIGFVFVGAVACGVNNDVNEGYRLGQVGFTIYRRYPVKAWFGRLCAFYYEAIHCRKRPVLEMLQPLHDASRVAFESGDVEFGTITHVVRCNAQFEYAPIGTTEREVSPVMDRMIFHGQELDSWIVRSLRQVILNLMGQYYESPTILTGAVMNDGDTSKLPKSHIYELFFNFHRMFLSFLFCDYDKALKQSYKCQGLAVHPMTVLESAMQSLYEGLVLVAVARKNGRKRVSRRALFLLRMLRVRARDAPGNFLGKQKLLEAEIIGLRGKHQSACAKYLEAIALARETKILLQVAVALELAAKYHLKQGENRWQALTLWNEAVEAYRQWGASEKAKFLEAEIAQEKRDKNMLINDRQDCEKFVRNHFGHSS